MVSAPEETLVPASVLISSPSSVDGVTAEVERQHRIWGCELIQESGILLRLPQVAVVTGQTLLHRFYYRQSLKKFDAFRTAMACTFLAAKIEEQPKSIKDLLNVFFHIYQKRRRMYRIPLDIGGDRYCQWKDDLFLLERQMLIDLGFSLYKMMHHPHKFILYYIKALDLSQEVAQSAWNYLNDSLRLDLCVRYPGQVIACAAIFLSCRFLRVKLPDNPPWWGIFDASLDDILAVSGQLLRLYRVQRVQWLDPLLPNAIYNEDASRFIKEGPAEEAMEESVVKDIEIGKPSERDQVNGLSKKLSPKKPEESLRNGKEGQESPRQTRTPAKVDNDGDERTLEKKRSQERSSSNSKRTSSRRSRSRSRSRRDRYSNSRSGEREKERRTRSPSRSRDRGRKGRSSYYYGNDRDSGRRYRRR